MKDKVLQFDADKERNITLALANFLNKNGWQVVACHPPGGHTSFSILDGRRSKGGYLPDVVAIKFDNNIDEFVVLLAENKPIFQQSDSDIQKLLKLSDVHAQWIAFRLQNHIDPDKWLNSWRTKLQKVIACAGGSIPKKNIPQDITVIKFDITKPPQIFVGPKSPARRILINKTFANK